jgi:hypothetical protein
VHAERKGEGGHEPVNSWNRATEKSRFWNESSANISVVARSNERGSGDDETVSTWDGTPWWASALDAAVEANVPGRALNTPDRSASRK